MLTLRWMQSILNVVFLGILIIRVQGHEAVQTMEETPPELRNVLLYAQSLITKGHPGIPSQSTTGAATRQLLSTDSEIGCGFYSLEDQGCATCDIFYTSSECTHMFYSFYNGTDTVIQDHGPEVVYSNDFDDDLTNDEFQQGSSQGGLHGDYFLGNFTCGVELRFFTHFPGTPSTLVGFSLSYVLESPPGDLETFPIKVLGEEAGTVLPVSETVGQTTRYGEPMYILQSSYQFSAKGETLGLKIIPACNGLFGIDDVEIVSQTMDYPPVVIDREVEVAAGEETTIQLFADDDECLLSALSISTLPASGYLYPCSCSEIWTQPITEEQLPWNITDSECGRVVYAPIDFEDYFTDSFTYIATDARGQQSNVGTVSLYSNASSFDQQLPTAGPSGMAAYLQGSQVISVPSLAVASEGFTVDLRMQFLYDSLSTMTLIASNQTYSLEWEAANSILSLRVGPSIASTHYQFQRGEWYHILLSYDALQPVVTVYVDSHAVVSIDGYNMTAVPVTGEEIALGNVLSRGNAIPSMGFRGFIDEFKFWRCAVGQSINSSYTKLSSFALLALEGGPQSCLVTYYTFNQFSAGFVLDITSNNHTGALGTIDPSTNISSSLFQPTLKPSTLKLPAQHVETEENVPIIILLQGESGEEGDLLSYRIHTFPRLGALYHLVSNDPLVLGEMIEYETTDIVSPMVVYISNTSQHGMDIFKYMAHQEMNGVSSYPIGVKINVKPVNDKPQAFNVSISAALDNLNNGEIRNYYPILLNATDPEDNKNISLYITSFPQYGILFQAEWSSNDFANGVLDYLPLSLIAKGDAINTESSILSENNPVILYLPLIYNADQTDEFGYSAFDGELWSDEAGVKITEIADLDSIGGVPVAGDSGYAISFDGVSDLLIAESDLLGGYQSSGFTIELYFRCRPLPHIHRMTIFTIGNLSLSISQVSGLTLTFGDDHLQTHESYQNGGWHRAVIVKNQTAAALFVDAQAWYMPSKTIALTGNLTLGGDMLGNFFSGEIDEMSIWGKAKTATQVEESDGHIYTGSESGLLAYYRFNNVSIVASSFLVSQVSETNISFRPSELDQHSAPSYLPSSLEIGNEAEIKEGHQVAIQLVALLEDVVAVPIITDLDNMDFFSIDMFQGIPHPNGTVSRGDRITDAGTAVETSWIILESQMGLAGDSVTYFSYGACRDLNSLFYGDCAVGQMQVTFVVKITNTTHPPVVLGPTTAVTGVSNMPKDFILNAQDTISVQNTSWVQIVRLPLYGVLEVASTGQFIETLSSYIETGNSSTIHMRYRPLPHSPDITSDSFSYVVSNGILSTNDFQVSVEFDLDFDDSEGVPVLGNAGNAYAFDGTMQQIAFLGNASFYNISMDFAVAGFIQVMSGPSLLKQTILLAGPFWVYIDPVGGLSFRVSDGIQEELVVQTFQFQTDRAWHHFLATYENQKHTIALYVDGKLAGQKSAFDIGPFDGGLPLLVNGSIILGAGLESNNYTYFFSGLMDDVSIWNNLSTAADKTLSEQFYKRQTLTGSEEGLMGYWRFNSILTDLLVNEVMGWQDFEYSHGGIQGLPHTSPQFIPSTLVLRNDFVVDASSQVDILLSSFQDVVFAFQVVQGPLNGSLTEDPTFPLVTYTPHSNFTGQDSFLVMAKDPNGAESFAATFNVLVTPAPEALVVLDESIEVESAVDLNLDADALVEDGQLILLTSTLDEAAVVQFYLITLPRGLLYSNGSLISTVGPVPSPQLVFRPPINDFDNDTFLYTACTVDNICAEPSTILLSPAPFQMERALTENQGLALKFNGTGIAMLGSLEDYAMERGYGMLLEIIFKTSAPLQQARTVLFESCEYSLEWVRSGGFQFRIGSTHVAVSAGLFLNDGVWYKIRAGAQGANATLQVATPGRTSWETIVNVTVPAPYPPNQKSYFSDPCADTNIWVGRSNISHSSGFIGEIDSIDIYTHLGWKVASFDFDEPGGEGLFNSITSDMDGSLGIDGLATAARVYSTAPSKDLISFSVELRKDEEMTIRLGGKSFLADMASIPLQYNITAIPSITTGAIYQVFENGTKSAAITSVPTMVNNSNGDIIYVPFLDLNETSTYIDIFKYRGFFNSDPEAYSDEFTQLIFVAGVSDFSGLVPVLPTSYTVENGGLIELVLKSGRSMQAQQGYYTVSRLPLKGVLLHPDRSTIVTRVGVPAMEGSLYYMPVEGKNGIDHLAVRFSDGLYSTDEIVLTINIVGDSALSLASSDAHAEFNSTAVGDILSALDQNQTFTITAWAQSDEILTSAVEIVTAASTSISLESGEIVAEKNQSWPPKLTAVNAELGELEAGKWFHIALVHEKDEGAELFVNGKLHAISAVNSQHYSGDQTLTIGKSNSSYRRCFDDIVIYSASLSQDEILKAKAGLWSQIFKPQLIKLDFGEFDLEEDDSVAANASSYIRSQHRPSTYVTSAAQTVCPSLLKRSAGHALRLSQAGNDTISLSTGLKPTDSVYAVEFWIKAEIGFPKTVKILQMSSVGVHLKRFSGLSVSLSPTFIVNAEVSWDDRAWHYVSISVERSEDLVAQYWGEGLLGPVAVSIKIDDEPPVTSSGEAVYSSVIGNNIVLNPSLQTLNRFQGDLDELRIFNTLRTNTADRFLALNSSEDSLMSAYYNFDEVDEYDLVGHLVESSAPTGDYGSIQVHEGSDTELVLYADDVDSDLVKLAIETLPDEGTLFSDGIPLHQLGSGQILPTSIASKVTYRAENYKTGKTYFSYKASDGRGVSHVSYVVIDIIPSVKAPALQGPALSFILSPSEPSQTIFLNATSGLPDDSHLVYEITTLPADGSLQQISGDPIAHKSYFLEEPVVVYQKPDLVKDPFDALFGYVVHDGHQSSREKIARVHVEGGNVDQPYSDPAGLALRMDGNSTYLTFSIGNISSFTLEFYFATNAVVDEHTTLVDIVSSGVSELSIKLASLLSGGLALQRKGSLIASTMERLNDGLVHHISLIVQSGLNSVSLGVDGEFVTATSPDILDLGGSYMVLGAANDASPETLFQGQFDDVRLFSYPRTPEEILAQKKTRISSMVSGLWAYFTFDGTTVKGPEVDDVTGNGNSAVVSGNVITEPSLAPLTVHSAASVQSTTVSIDLSASTLAHDALPAAIMFLPEKGHLDVSGTIITSVPYLVSSEHIDYTPPSTEFGEPLDLFGYGVVNSTSGAVSSESIIQINIKNQNDMFDLAKIVSLPTFNCSEGETVSITLEVIDVDLLDETSGDSITFEIVLIPQYGKLHLGNEDSQVVYQGYKSQEKDVIVDRASGSATMKLNYSLGAGVVWFDDALMRYTTIGVVVHDSEFSSHPLPVNIRLLPLNNATVVMYKGENPLVNGQAAVFGGYNSTLSLNPAGTATSDFTLSFYFNTDAAIHEKVVLLTYGNVLDVFWTLPEGLSATVLDATLTSKEFFNDGRWHFLVLKSDGFIGEMWVDGMMVGSTVVPLNVKLPVGGELLLGSSEEEGSFFNGLIDDIRWYNRTLSLAELSAASQYLISDFSMEAGLTNYISFDNSQGGYSTYAGVSDTQAGSSLFSNQSMVHFVTSFAPLQPSTYLVQASHRVLVQLSTISPSNKAFISSLPEAGYIETSLESPIDAVPFEIESASFFYQAPPTPGRFHVGVSSSVSSSLVAVNESRIYFEVVPGDIEGSPVVMVPEPLTAIANQPLHITLHAADPNPQDKLSFYITSLPDYGKVYQSVNGSIGEEITSIGTMISSVSTVTRRAFIVFVAACEDSFSTSRVGFVASDGDLTSNEGLVTIDVKQPWSSLTSVEAQPFSKLVGYSLILDGLDDFLWLSQVSASESHSISFWIKSSGALPDEVTMLSYGSLEVFWTVETGLGLAIDDTTKVFASSPVINDGQWHNIAGIHDASQQLYSLMLDGKLIITTNLSTLSAMGTTLSIGGRVVAQNGSVELVQETAFAGYIDTLSISYGDITPLDLLLKYGAFFHGDNSTGISLRFTDDELENGQIISEGGLGIGFLSGNPAIAISDSPVTVVLSVVEGQTLDIPLISKNAEWNGTVAVQDYPIHGKLGDASATSDLECEDIWDSCARIRLAYGGIQYVSTIGEKANASTSSLSDSMDGFSLVLYDDLCASVEKSFAVTIEPAQLPPQLQSPQESVSVERFSGTSIQLTASHPSPNEKLTFIFTSLPKYGELFVWDPVSGEKMESLNENMGRVAFQSVMSHNNSYEYVALVKYELIYMAIANGSVQDQFSYTVESKNGLSPPYHLGSSVTETIVVLDFENLESTPLPIISDAGYALSMRNGGFAELKSFELSLKHGMALQLFLRCVNGVSRSTEVVLTSQDLLLNHDAGHGLTFSIGQYEIASGWPMTDEAWHHVSISVSGQKISLFADNLLIASQQISSQVPLPEKLSGLTLGSQFDGFSGVLDDLRIWSTSIDSLSQLVPSQYFSWSDSRTVPVSGAETALEYYFNFNEGDGVSARDRVTGANMSLNLVRWIPATHQLRSQIITVEDVPTHYTLQAPEGVEVFISSPPKYGVLKSVVTGEVLSGPLYNHFTQSITEAMTVQYEPNLDFFGTDGFTIKGSRSQVMTAEETVAITVVPVQDAPRINSYTSQIVCEADSACSFSVTASDHDNDAIEIHILALPFTGSLSLEQDGNGFVTSLPFVTALPEGSTVSNWTFTPYSNARPGDIDMVTLVAFDGTEYSEAVSVNISAFPDTVGIIGEVEIPTEIVSSLDSSEGITVELWAKLNDLPGQRRRLASVASSTTIVGSTPYTLNQSNSIQVMNAGQFDTSAPSFLIAPDLLVPPPVVMDGQWHHVALTFKDGLRAAYVDAVLTVSQSGPLFLGSDLDLTPIVGAPVVIPSNATFQDLIAFMTMGTPLDQVFQNGKIDDLRIWSCIRTHGEIALNTNTMFPSSTPNLAYFQDFGDKYTGPKEIERKPIAGQAGHALKFSKGITASVSSPFFSGSITVQLWLRASQSLPKRSVLVGQGDSSVGEQEAFVLQWTPFKGLEFSVHKSTGEKAAVRSEQYLNDGAWHFLSVSYSASTGRLEMIIDGGASKIVQSPAAPLIDSQDDIFMGGKGARFFNGAIDDFAVYSRALQAFEVLQLWSTGQYQNTSDVALEYLFQFNSWVGSVNQTLDSITSETMTISTEDNIFVTSSTPLSNRVKVKSEGVCLELQGFDNDGDTVVFVISSLPVRGRLLETNNNDCKQVGKEIQHQGMPIPSKVVFLPLESEIKSQKNYSSFSYVVSDKLKMSNPETVILDFVAENMSPLAISSSIVIVEDTNKTVAIVLESSDTEDGFATSARITSLPELGTLNVGLGESIALGQNGDGKLSVLYTPDPNVFGQDTFSFVVLDSEGLESNEATVTITIQSVNDAPIIQGPDTFYVLTNLTKLSGIKILDVDALVATVKVTISMETGSFSLNSANEAVNQEQSYATQTMTLQDINLALCSFYVYIPSLMGKTSLYISVDDLGNSGSGLSKISSKAFSIQMIDTVYQSILFSDNGQDVVATFKQETDLGGAEVGDTIDCGVLYGSANVSSFGQNSECVWTSAKAHVLKLGSNPSIIPGHNVSLSGSPIRILSTGETVPAYVLPVSGPLSPQKPSGSIVGPQGLQSFCNNLEISSATSGDLDRELGYFWSASGSMEFMTFVSGQLGGEFTIPSTLLEPDTAYSLSLRVKNFVGGVSEVSSIVFETESDSGPSVSILGDDLVTVTPSQQVLFETSLSSIPCNISEQDFAYNWTQIKGADILSKLPAGALEQSFLSIPPEDLEAGEFEFQVEISTMASGQWVSVDAVNLTVISLSLVARISAALTQSSTSDLILDGSGSFDPESGEALTYMWNCTFLTELGPCPFVIATSGAVADIPASSLVVGNYEFTLTVSVSDGRAASTEVQVQVVEEEIPSIFISGPAFVKFSSSEFLTLVATATSNPNRSGADSLLLYEWTYAGAPLQGCAGSQFPECTFAGPTPDLASISEGSSTDILTINKGSLSPGRYMISVVTRYESTPSLTTTAEFPVVVNSAPQSGSISFSPSQVSELTTTVTIQALDWIDVDLPLRYEYGLLTMANQSSSYMKLTTSTFSTAEVLLPAVAKALVVRVIDIYGDAAEASIDIEVTSLSESGKNTTEVLELVTQMIDEALSDIDSKSSSDLLSLLVTVGLVKHDILVSLSGDPQSQKKAEEAIASYITLLEMVSQRSDVSHEDMISPLLVISQIVDLDSPVSLSLEQLLNILNIVLDQVTQVGVSDDTAEGYINLISILYKALLQSATTTSTISATSSAPETASIDNINRQLINSLRALAISLLNSPQNPAGKIIQLPLEGSIGSGVLSLSGFKRIKSDLERIGGPLSISMADFTLPATILSSSSVDTFDRTYYFISWTYENPSNPFLAFTDAELPLSTSVSAIEILDEIDTSTSLEIKNLGFPGEPSRIQMDMDRVLNFTSSRPKPECLFFDSTIQEWATEGLTVIAFDPTSSSISCQSSHMTHFAAREVAAEPSPPLPPPMALPPPLVQPVESPTQNSGPGSGGGGGSDLPIAAIAGGASAGALLLGLLLYFVIKRRRQKEARIVARTKKPLCNKAPVSQNEKRPRYSKPTVTPDDSASQISEESMNNPGTPLLS